MKELMESVDYAVRQGKKVVEIRVSEEYLKEMIDENKRMIIFPEGHVLDKFMGIPIVSDPKISGKDHEIVLGRR